MHTKVTLRFGRHDFEYDIYALLKAFWPQAEITTRYTDELPAENLFGQEKAAQNVGTDGTDGEAETLCELLFREGRPVSGEITRTAAEKEVGSEAQAETEVVGFRLRPTGEEAAALLGLSSAEESFREVVICRNWDRITVKNHVKELVYRTLAERTGRELPWGDLTGIRPVKLMSGLLDAGYSDDEAQRYMRDTWFVSGRKARLALDTARREEALMRDFPAEEGYSLYIGIPFCPTICLYCSFGSHPLQVWKKSTDTYLETLEKELRGIRDLVQGRYPDTIYIGGGTPTSLSEEQLARLLHCVSELFVSDSLREFTVEAGRPDTITEEKLHILRQFPVDRISVNPQTMNTQTLERIGRQHTVEETRKAFYRAREAGFANINMDLIVGLPGEGEPEVTHTLEEIRKLNPDSLTVHSLALKRATRLHLFRDDYEEESFVNSERIMELTEQCAADLGMTPYYLYRQKNIAGNFENVGYARDGKACLYNILIMEQRQTILGAGSGASSKRILEGGSRVERAENVKDLRQYLTRIDEMLERKRTLLSIGSGAG